jgi:hypothetical protein
MIVLLSLTNSWASTIDLPRTGQTKCYNYTHSSGPEIPCAGTGQDGEFQAGVSWPSPRFLNHLDGTVTDLLTGLMWTTNANGPGPGICKTGWQAGWETLEYIKCLNINNYLGYSDWRLPNKTELRSLVDHSQFSPALLMDHPFIDVQVGYWSSTSNVNNPEVIWVVYMVEGGMYFAANRNNASAIWPVRTDSLGVVRLPQTGQTKCYEIFEYFSWIEVACPGTGQDGDLRIGAPWPKSRFSIMGESVFDNLTGLTWMRNPDNLLRTWEEALQYSNSLSLCGFSDWRLPNILELESLANANEPDISLWLQGQGFSGVIGADVYRYWSSTPMYRGAYIYVVRMLDGLVSYGAAYTNYTLPVRSGPPLLQIAIDIKPGSNSNCFNQNEKGVIPVAIFGSNDLDVTKIKIESLALQGLSVKMTGKSKKFLAHYEDINADDYLDLIVQFQDSDKWIVSGNDYATVTGILNNGTLIEGQPKSIHFG